MKKLDHQGAEEVTSRVDSCDASFCEAPRRGVRSASDGLLERPAPFPAVARALDRTQSEAMLHGISARAAGDDQVIPGLERVGMNALPAQLQRSAPFHGPSLDLTVFIRSIDSHERVRVADFKLDELPLNPLRLLF